MRLKTTALVVGVAAALLLATASTLPAKRLEEAAIFIEINDTDGDAGIQVFLDGEDWDSMQLTGPDGTVLLSVLADGSVAIQGMTELFFESAEPSFDEQPLADFLDLFPPGKYKFRGTTTDDKVLKGKARLTHRIPDAPVQVFPLDEAVDPDDAVFEWEAVADPQGSEIIGYHIVVECEEPELMVFTVDVGPDVTSITVPPEFLDQGGEECKWEAIAREDSGNQTISEAEFEID